MRMRNRLYMIAGTLVYLAAVAWLALVSDPRCKRTIPSDGPALEIERMFPKDCRAEAGGAK
jgi:hypothetical protein